MFSLIGQSSASIMMSCDMMDLSGATMSHNMTMSEHSMAMPDHMMSMPMEMQNHDEANMTMAADCCQDNCDCATASCNPNSYTSSLTTLAVTIVSTDSNHQEIPLPQTQFLNYLFKPPIS